MIKSRLKTDAILLALFVLAFIGNIILPVFGIKGVTNVLYSLIAFLWICSLQKEIKDKYIRYCLQAGGILLILLFVLRYLRWDLVPEGTKGYRMIWYAYYISFIGLPGLSLAVSVFIGSKKKNRFFMHFLATSCILLILLVMTNDLHGAVMLVEKRDGTEYSIYRPLYYFIIAWYSVMLISSLVLVLNKCRLHVARKLWWVPPVFGIPGFVMWGIYYALGGTSPRIAGISLYNIQEVYLLVFIGMWESCIMVGLVPSRSLSREREWIREGILNSIKNEFAELKKIYSELKQASKEEFRAKLMRLSCIGAYIKRRANLELITDTRGYLNTRELSLAVREAFEYYSLEGMSTGYEETGNMEVPSLLVIWAFELFKDVAENVAGSACYVKLAVYEDKDRSAVKLSIEAAPEDKGEENLALIAERIKERLPFIPDAKQDIRIEDETALIDIEVSLKGKGGELTPFRLLRNIRTKRHLGLAGMTSYLSLEEDAMRMKTGIHDSLGRGLLMNKRYLTMGGAIPEEDITDVWGSIIAGIEGRKQDRHKNENDIECCIRQAGELGVKLVMAEGSIFPGDEDLREVTDAAITAHITNMLKHTKADVAHISIVRQEEGFTLVLTDNGNERIKNIQETGGLKNLRNRVEAAGGSMRVEKDPMFKLLIRLPEKG